MDLELTGRRALITGGSRGIGKAIARQLALEGCEVCLAARNPAALTATATELSSETGRRVATAIVDTGSDESVAAMVAAATNEIGGVDILVNNAAKVGGIAAPPKLAEITDDAFYSDVNVKVMGYLRCAREVAPLMAASGWGRIINISGLAARSTGSTIGSIRNVSVAALTKNLADELGPKGINVTVVHPGLTKTETTVALFATRAEAAGVDAAEWERRMAAGNSIRRVVDATEVAYLVAFLASPKSVAVNGDAIACGGGTTGPIFY